MVTSWHYFLFLIECRGKMTTLSDWHDSLLLQATAMSARKISTAQTDVVWRREEARRSHCRASSPTPVHSTSPVSPLRSSHEEERTRLLHKVELLLWTRHGGTFHCSTLLATTLPKTRSSTAGCSDVWACNRSWQREEGIASERNCVCAAHPSQDQDMTQVKIYQTHWLVEDLTYLLEGLLNQSICFPN